MIAPLPFARSYNLNRLGQGGDDVAFAAGEEDRAALARFADLLRVEKFEAWAELKKISPNRFQVDFRLEADLVQACVVTLVDVPAHIGRAFTRELHFNPAPRRGGAVPESPQTPDLLRDDDVPEEIDSLHYDLAAPLIEEFVLGLEPYPRAPGVEFQPRQDAGEAPQNPFAALKGLKSGL